MAETRKIIASTSSDRALYRRGETALYRAARLHFRGRRGVLRRIVRRYLKPHRRDRVFLGKLTSSVARVLTVALLMLELGATAVDAQPNFSSSSPANATHATAVSANISSTFSQAITSGTVSSSTFVVHGGFIGQHSTGGTASTHKDGTYTGQGTPTLTFNPGANFKAGELVSVTLTTGLQNGSAQALTAAKVYQFRAATSTGPAIFTNVSYDVDTPTNKTRDASLGDLDGDGDLDLVTGNLSQVNRVYLNNGNGTFASGSDVDTPTTSTYDVSLGDVDGDGDLDFIAGDGGRNQLYLGNGNGTFASGSDVATTSRTTRSASLGDIDGDGDLDLVTGNQGWTNRFYLSNGNGTFASGSDVDTPVNTGMGMPLGDVDGDGDLDIVVGNYSAVNRVYLNNGVTLSSTSPTANANNIATTSNISPTFSQSMNVGSSSTFVVHGGMTGQRAGSYSGASSTTLTFDPTSDFKAGEKVVVTLTASLTATGGDVLAARVFEFRAATSTGPAIFSNVSQDVDAATNNTLATSFGDLDADGDLDLVTGNSGVNRVYLSNGNGTFATGSDVDTPSPHLKSLLGAKRLSGRLNIPPPAKGLCSMPEAEKVAAIVWEWIEKAENDLKNAAHTLKMGADCPTDTVCFHAQ